MCPKQGSVKYRLGFIRSDSEAEPGITEVTTQARGKGGGANIPLASEIDKMIALQLQAGN